MKKHLSTLAILTLLLGWAAGLLSAAAAPSPTLASEAAGISPQRVRALELLVTSGLLLMPDSNADRVIAFDATTGNLVDPDFIPPDPTNLSTPVNAILSASGDSILVSDQVKDVVQEYDLNGSYLGVFAPAGGANPAILDNIRGIALRPNGNLLVTVGGGSNANSVAEFDTGGNYLGNFVAIGAGGLDSPFDVYLRGADWIVGGINSDAIHRYDLNGAYIANLAAINSFPEQLAQAANDNVLVANFSGTQEGIVEYLPDGTLVGVYNAGTLGGYRGVYELPNGNLLVTTGTGVYEIDRVGNVVDTKITDVSGRFLEWVVFSVGSDLVLTKTAALALAAPGDTVTYTLSFAQVGSYTTTGAVIDDVVPAGLVNLHYTSSGAVITPTGVISYSWLVQDLAPGEGGIITITGQLDDGLAGGTVLTNTGTITGPEPDDNPTNNSGTAIVTVLNVPPVAVDDQAETLQDQPVTILVLDNDFDPNGDPLAVAAVGAPLNGSSSTDGASVTYSPTPGFYGTDTFTYTSSDGELGDSAWITVNVLRCDVPSEVEFTWEPLTPTVGAMVTFTGEATGTQPLTYTWDLGDGATAGGMTTTHAYAAAGDYTVVLTVSNGCGQQVVSHVVWVVEPCVPVGDAGFAWEPLTPTVGTMVTFTGEATGTQPLTYTWDLGDGATAGGMTTTHAYAAAGDYTVVLTVSNGCGQQVVTRHLAVVTVPEIFRIYLPLVVRF